MWILLGFVRSLCVKQENKIERRFISNSHIRWIGSEKCRTRKHRFDAAGITQVRAKRPAVPIVEQHKHNVIYTDATNRIE